MNIKETLFDINKEIEMIEDITIPQYKSTELNKILLYSDIYQKRVKIKKIYRKLSIIKYQMEELYGNKNN